MFLVGVGTAVIGAASKNIGLTASQIGLMITLQNLGFLVSLLVSGTLADTLKKTTLLGIASIVLGISFSLFYIRPGFLINLIIMIVIGLGMGAYEGVADTLLLEIHTKRENLYISINHFFVTFGELMITLYLVFLQMQWRRSVLQAGIAAAVLAVLFLLSRTEHRPTEMKKLSRRFEHMRKQRGTGTLFILTLCVIGTELGVIGIMTSFLMDFRGFTLVTSKLGMVVFLAGIAFGRGIIGFITKKGKLGGFLIGLLGLTVVLLAVVFSLPVGTVPLYGAMFLLGVTLSGIFPLIITITGLRYKEIAGTVLGIVKLGIPIGGIVVPFLLAVLSGWWGFQAALALFPAVCFVGLVVLLVQLKHFR